MEASKGMIAVFGGGGFIGSHLCQRLIDQGKSIVAVDIDSEKIANLFSEESFTFHEADITDEENDELCRQVVNEADVVFDLIAYANPQQYVDKPLEVVELNLFENLKIVDLCEETDTRLIQFSTCEVYGLLGNRDDIIFSEDSSNLILGPIEDQRWIYSCAKQLLERMVHAHGQENQLQYTIIRPFNFIGPQMDYLVESPDEGTPRVFASFMSALLFGHPMYLVNGGTNRRTFTYIDDAIDAIMLILRNEGGQFDREIVNVGHPNNEVTIEEFANRMRAIYAELSPNGTLPELRTISGEEFYGEGYDDSERRIPNTDKLQSAGWEPRYSLEELLTESIQYYIDQFESDLDV